MRGMRIQLDEDWLVDDWRVWGQSWVRTWGYEDTVGWRLTRWGLLVMRTKLGKDLRVWGYSWMMTDEMKIAGDEDKGGWGFIFEILWGLLRWGLEGMRTESSEDWFIGFFEDWRGEDWRVWRLTLVRTRWSDYMRTVEVRTRGYED